MGTRHSLPLSVATLAAIIMLILLPACKGTTTPDPPDPPATKYQHSLTVQAITLHTDSAVTGTVQVTMRSKAGTYTGAIGEKITLATTTTQEESCDILISATDCLPREFTEVGVKDSTLSTNVVKLSDVDWDYVWYIMPDGVNRSWVPRKFEVYFNPDRLTGLRLDESNIGGVKNALLYVQENSKGYIQTVTFHEDGTKPEDPTVPPDGDIWVYRVSDMSGVANATYPNSYAKVLASKILLNVDNSYGSVSYMETFDALFGAGQEFGSGDHIGPFFMLMLNRPRDTNNYVITSQKETQKGIDSQTTFTSAASLIRTDALATSDLAGASSPLPTTQQAVPSRPSTAQPARKDRIRN